MLGKPRGQRSLVGYCPCGCKELDMTEVTAHTGAYTCVCVWVCKCVGSWVCKCMYVCMRTFKGVRACALCEYMCVCTYVFICVMCIAVCVCECACVHTHASTWGYVCQLDLVIYFWWVEYDQYDRTPFPSLTYQGFWLQPCPHPLWPSQFTTLIKRAITKERPAWKGAEATAYEEPDPANNHVNELGGKSFPS